MNLLSLACLLSMVTCLPVNNKKIADSSVFFAGTTPCSNIIRPLHKIPVEPDCPLNDCHCILVEWKLTLNSNPVTGQPTTYTLTGINRFAVKETNMYSDPGTKSERSGTWRMIKGTKRNPEAIVYQLQPDEPTISVSMLRLSDNLLHILDADDQLLIGNEFCSYTLNRVLNNNQ